MARQVPDWPRLMRRELASAYVDMPIAEFERAVAKGELPGPHVIGDRERWSRAEIDARLERLTGGEAPDWREKCGIYQGRAA